MDKKIISLANKIKDKATNRQNIYIKTVVETGIEFGRKNKISYLQSINFETPNKINDKGCTESISHETIYDEQGNELKSTDIITVHTPEGIATYTTIDGVISGRLYNPLTGETFTIDIEGNDTSIVDYDASKVFTTDDKGIKDVTEITSKYESGKTKTSINYKFNTSRDIINKMYASYSEDGKTIIYDHEEYDEKGNRTEDADSYSMIKELGEYTFKSYHEKNGNTIYRLVDKDNKVILKTTKMEGFDYYEVYLGDLCKDDGIEDLILKVYDEKGKISILFDGTTTTVEGDVIIKNSVYSRTESYTDAEGNDIVKTYEYYNPNED